MSKKRTTPISAGYTISELAKLLHCHVNGIRKWIKSGDLPATMVKHHWVIAKKDWEEFQKEWFDNADL